eukprot:GHVS01063224.1.p1 GENE.GHVS01063224.1~~GHVS01063224.1.p1  ORF type:complete len:397 (+),score=15.32 GHVS01063224.1:132-1322(+)
MEVVTMRLFSLTSVVDGFKMPELSDLPVVRCYNVPSGLSVQSLDESIKLALENHYASNGEGKRKSRLPGTCPYAIRQIRPPSKAEIPGVHTHKVICENQETADALLDIGSINVPLPLFVGEPRSNSLSEVSVRFWKGSKWDVGYVLPVAPPVGTRGPGQNSMQGPVGRNTMLHENTFYWLDGRLNHMGTNRTRGSGRDASAMGLPISGPASAMGLPISGPGANHCQQHTSAYADEGRRDNLFAFRAVWPVETPWRDVSDEAKRKLCVVFRNKPAEWDRGFLEDFMHSQFEGDPNAPIIQSIFMTKQFPKLATIACHDETSRNRFMRIGVFKLPPKWAALNLSRGMADRISVQSWTPPNMGTLYRSIGSPSEKCYGEPTNRRETAGARKGDSPVTAL